LEESDCVSAQKILILGVTSAIAEATARRFADKGATFFIVGRQFKRVKAICEDLKIRGAPKCDFQVADLRDRSKHVQLLEQARASLGSIDLAILAYGILGDHARGIRDFEHAHDIFETNFISHTSLLTHLANTLEAQRSGALCVVTSVAGDRGRQSNYIYGASKGGLSVFLSGLRNRLYANGVQVLDVRPGFVDTPMTEAFKKGPLWASPAKIARGIETSLWLRKNVAYLPWFWSWIMWVIRSIPESVFKRLKL